MPKGYSCTGITYIIQFREWNLQSAVENYLPLFSVGVIQEISVEDESIMASYTHEDENDNWLAIFSSRSRFVPALAVHKGA